MTTANSSQGIAKSTSLGSIDERRSNAFVSAQHRIVSFPRVPTRKSSRIISHSSATPRAPANLASGFNVDDTSLIPPSYPPQTLFMGDLRLPVSISASPCTSQFSTPAFGSKAHSYRALRPASSSPLLPRAATFRGMEPSLDQMKVPLFVPSRIVRPQIPTRKASRPTFDPALSVGDAAQDFEPPMLPPIKVCHPIDAAGSSEASEWSIKAQPETQTYEVAQPGWDTTGGRDANIMAKPRPPPARLSSNSVPLPIPENPLPLGLKAIQQAREEANKKRNRKQRLRRMCGVCALKLGNFLRGRPVSSKPDNSNDDD